MKRALRVLVLGPIYAVAGTFVVLVLPVLWLLNWIMGDVDEFWSIWIEIGTDAAHEVWNGRST